MRDDDTEKISLARVGTVINGKWTVDQLIGVGGMASVYAATHRNAKRAALKIMHPELSAQATIRERFLREGYLSNMVDHPGVVKVDDDDVTEDGCAFLVMELCEGETLEARLRRKGPLPPEEVLSFMDQVLHALATAHTRGVVHRDLKPENMLLAPNGEVKLLDFGIARARALSTDPTKTLTDGLMGTPAFMPPEQARGRWEEVDAQSDVWALGATMFTLLTGRNVHQASTTNEALAVAMMRQAKPLENYRPDLPSSVLELVNKALAFEKKDRWPNATVMLLAVRRATARIEEEILAAEAAEAAFAVHSDSQPELFVAEADGSGPEVIEAGGVPSRPSAPAPSQASGPSQPSAPPSKPSSPPRPSSRPQPAHANQELASAPSQPVEDPPTVPFNSETPFAPPTSATGFEMGAPQPLDDVNDATLTPLARPEGLGPAEPSSDGGAPSADDDSARTRYAAEPTPAVDSPAEMAPPSSAGALASTPTASSAPGLALPAEASVTQPAPESEAPSAPSAAHLDTPVTSRRAEPPTDGSAAAQRYLAKKAAHASEPVAAVSAPSHPTSELPARRVVPFSDVPATPAVVARPTETTTARSALTLGAPSQSRTRWPLIAGAVAAVVLLLLGIAVVGGDDEDESDARAAARSEAPALQPAADDAELEPGRIEQDQAPETQAAGAIDREPEGAEPAPAPAEADEPGEEPVDLETLPLLSATPSSQPVAPPHRYVRPKAKSKPSQTNIFNQAKNLAVKRATVRSDKVKSGRAE